MKSLWDKFKVWFKAVRWVTVGLILLYGGTCAAFARDIGGVVFLFLAFLFLRFIVGKFPNLSKKI